MLHVPSMEGLAPSVSKRGNYLLPFLLQEDLQLSVSAFFTGNVSVVTTIPIRIAKMPLKLRSDSPPSDCVVLGSKNPMTLVPGIVVRSTPRFWASFATNSLAALGRLAR